jgi:nucleoid DNA-binding protein
MVKADIPEKVQESADLTKKDSAEMVEEGFFIITWKDCAGA